MPDVPAAYFLTFRAYGSWLPGDARGSTGWRQNAPGSPPLDVDASLELRSRARLRTDAVYFDAARRAAIAEAIREVCAVREWALLALNVRTNHVHVVVQCDARPERALLNFKAYATKRMVEARAFRAGERPWSRHGSTRYLWNERDIDAACQYVINGQGDDPDPSGTT